ncbi:MAG: DUF2868 domain-containing protein [Pseudomonadota bacterium]
MTMKEQVAREVLLVRAIENADRQHRVLSDDDRRYASRSAQELALWQAAEQQTALTPELFLEKRAQQILKKLAERTPSFAALAKHRDWLKLCAVILPLAALLLGAFTDRISDPHRVDLLSAPLLLILAWNVLVYLGLLLEFFIPQTGLHKLDFGFAQKLGKRKRHLPRRLPYELSAALSGFIGEWTMLSAPLLVARLKRIMHLSAALFALGAVLSLYARGMLSEYRAGWESTFLDAGQVHTLLSALFWPATAVFQLHGFSTDDIAVLKFPASATGGALWVHLYGATLLLLVILPRLALAAFAGWRARTLAQNFPIDLQQAYFLKLTANVGDSAAVARVFPYSFTVDEARDKGLNAAARMLLGERARVMLRPSIEYGAAPQEALAYAQLDDPEITLSLALFTLSATPEKENHGAFLDYLRQNSPRGIAVWIDESGYLERFGQQAGAAARIGERCALWRQFCEQHNAAANIVNLLNPESSRAELERGPASSAAS